MEIKYPWRRQRNHSDHGSFISQRALIFIYWENYSDCQRKNRKKLPSSIFIIIPSSECQWYFLRVIQVDSFIMIMRNQSIRKMSKSIITMCSPENWVGCGYEGRKGEHRWAYQYNPSLLLATSWCYYIKWNISYPFVHMIQVSDSTLQSALEDNSNWLKRQSSKF